MTSAMSLVERIEECAFNAWPAATTVSCDGWLIRVSDGFTRRANSVSAWRPGPNFSAVVREAEQFYRAAGLAPVFRLSPLAAPDHDSFLDRNGYVKKDPTLVLTRPLDGSDVGCCPDVLMSETLELSWMADAARLTGIPQRLHGAHRRLLSAIRPAAAFASIPGPDGQSLACGLAVAEPGWVGLFEVAVAQEARRHGFGRQVVSALLDWGAAAGAHAAYLQVSEANGPARRLYDAMGFSTVYDYRYRIAGWAQP